MRFYCVSKIVSIPQSPRPIVFVAFIGMRIHDFYRLEIFFYGQCTNTTSLPVLQ